MPVTYVKMYKDGEWQKIESDRVERFQDEGWSLDPVKKSLTRNAITASAEVTSNVVEEIEEVEDPDWNDDLEDLLDDELPENEEN